MSFFKRLWKSLTAKEIDPSSLEGSLTSPAPVDSSLPPSLTSKRVINIGQVLDIFWTLVVIILVQFALAIILIVLSALLHILTQDTQLSSHLSATQVNAVEWMVTSLITLVFFISLMFSLVYLIYKVITNVTLLIKTIEKNVERSTEDESDPLRLA
jgi:hypothetical protein